MFGRKSAHTDKPAPDQTPKPTTQKTKPETYEKRYGKPHSLNLELGGILTLGSADVDGHRRDDLNKTDVQYSNFYSGVGGGGYFRLDGKYGEEVFDLVFYDKWVDMNASGLLKYPIGNDIIRVSPFLGFGAMGGECASGGFGFLIGGRIDVGITEMIYLRSEYLYGSDFNKYSAMLFKIGGGFDIGLGERKTFYVRPELMYNYYWGENTDTYYSDKDEGTENHIDVRISIGYKWGGKKRVKEQ